MVDHGHMGDGKTPHIDILSKTIGVRGLFQFATLQRLNIGSCAFQTLEYQPTKLGTSLWEEKMNSATYKHMDCVGKQGRLPPVSQRNLSTVNVFFLIFFLFLCNVVCRIQPLDEVR